MLPISSIARRLYPRLLSENLKNHVATSFGLTTGGVYSVVCPGGGQGGTDPPPPDNPDHYHLCGLL